MFIYIKFFIFYIKDHNEPPVANAGEDQVIYLPQRSVVLDGSRSQDDEIIVSYQWIRAGLSPAAGVCSYSMMLFLNILYYFIYILLLLDI